MTATSCRHAAGIAALVLSTVAGAAPISIDFSAPGSFVFTEHTEQGVVFLADPAATYGSGFYLPSDAMPFNLLNGQALELDFGSVLVINLSGFASVAGVSIDVGIAADVDVADVANVNLFLTSGALAAWDLSDPDPFGGSYERRFQYFGSDVQFITIQHDGEFGTILGVDNLVISDALEPPPPPIPEPSTYALMAVGLGILAGVARRARSAA